ncbi:cobaltochelatase subunit CobN [Desulfobacca acetoxidans]|uniref:Magnesium chelatase n=1 Tax=Desulfobacca acetoxidans (strain ATCC 700848 / DSM 11109 / ASRB2) TaxID=880072 RepID=F2NFD8_DESAR|nr:cobaltochelatase subunit CobN [Desulfobacca acetoxidans]AEB10057.1 Magnesium chelatase [Desulfobacca acetoxidans DSM 11109]
MSRNKAAAADGTLKSWRRFILALSCLLFWLFIFPGSAVAAKVKVSLLLGDISSKVATEAVKAVYQDYPNLRQKVEFHVYPTSGIREKNLLPLKESRLILVWIMGHNLIEAVKPELEAAIKKGIKVYYVGGGTYDDDQKKMGIRADKKMVAYFSQGGLENIKNLILYSLKQELGFEVSFRDEVVQNPESGIYEYRTRKVFADFEAYKKAYAYRDGRPWIGVVFYKNSIDGGQAKPLHAVIRSLEEAGFNVLPIYGRPLEEVMAKFFAPGGSPLKSRVRLVIAQGMKIGINPQIMIPLLTRLNIPLIDAISLYGRSRQEWEQSAVGLDIFERAFQIANPEMAGIIQPTVIASKEKRIDKSTGFEYLEENPIPERIARLTARVKAWVNLQDKPNKDKRIAIVYYNYPPGKQNIGASYLKVLPDSLWEILLKLRSAGYDVGGSEVEGQRPGLSKELLFEEIHNYGRNIGNYAPGELDRLGRRGKEMADPTSPPVGHGNEPVLIPLDTYKKWFEKLPEGLRSSVVKSWGPVEQSTIMIWSDAAGRKYLVIPAVRYGNILFAPQPSRGWEQDVKKLYHDLTIPPHHQYVAFFLWLKNGFQADAVAHIGTHGTHEWLPGKEVGFTGADAPEALIQDLPNIYPYIVDNVGEGLQAKRRGMGVIIDHMTPPFDKAGLNRELKELVAFLNDYGVAKGKSVPLAEAKLKEINALAKKIGLLTDLKMEEIKTEDEIEEVEHYIKEIGEKQTPFGLHTFGKSPEAARRKNMAEAILSLDSGLLPEERTKKLAELEDRINRSGPRELDSFLAGLSGQYIPAGRGNDPLRNPDSLPTGNNFYAFDPTRIPPKASYELGVKLARELIDIYKAKHGQYPDKLTFNLWSTETIRHEGVMDSQIMYLLGIKPRWDERGRVIGLEVISRKELGRPRADVTIIPSGLYRDLFPNLMDWLDKAVTLAKQQDEADNVLRTNYLRIRQMLLEKGVAKDQAERLATVRIFTEPPGAYGTNLDKVIPQSNTWEREQEVAEVYLRRLSYVYGQGFWGDKIQNSGKNGKDKEDLSLSLLKSTLSGTKVAVHSRSGNVYATLDNDDFFQYLGGTAMTIRTLDGKTPEVYVTNMTNPRLPKQETLEKAMGREMRSRYLNPEWIKGMMQEGYAGSRFIDKVVEHLWGWQVTVPETVDAAKWNEMYETYVLDKNGLNIKEMFRNSRNLFAYQSLVARMLETVRKGYWKPDRQVIETLSREYAESTKEVGLACCDHTCNNPLLTEFTASVLMSVPGLENQAKEFKQALDMVKNPPSGAKAVSAPAAPEGKKPPADAPPQEGQVSTQGDHQKVEGYEVQETNRSGFSAAPIPYLFIAGFLVFLALIRWGWLKKR